MDKGGKKHKKIRNCFKLKENESTKYQKFWNAAKPLLRMKFVALNACAWKEEKFQVSDLSFHLKKPEKQKQMILKVSRTKEIIKIRAKISELE